MQTKAEIAAADCIRLAIAVLCFNINILSKSRGAERRGDLMQVLALVPTCSGIASPACADSQVRVWSLPRAGSSSERRTDRNPSPFLPVRMCVYGNSIFYSSSRRRVRLWHSRPRMLQSRKNSRIRCRT